MKKQKMIGIVGGIGSYAGIDLIKKIYDFTQAFCDQDHLPVSMLSAPHKIVDRTEFLLGNITTNPGFAIHDIIKTLVSNGANIIGIPCNTAHASPIFDVITNQLPKSCKVIHLIDEVGHYLKTHLPKIRKVGILGTTGTLISKIYPKLLTHYNLTVIEPSQEIQDMFVQPAIYDKYYGIKTIANPISSKATNNLITAATYLSRKGAECIILGCTEIPLAIQEETIENSLILDATKILAKALIRESTITI
tara:strand:- start:200 stop:946 length:747 start_codon:yes stop_codon:yes gene_type:complete